MDKIKLWAIGIIVGLILLWIILGSLVGSAIKWAIVFGVPIFIALWLFGTWLPNRINRRKGG